MMRQARRIIDDYNRISSLSHHKAEKVFWDDFEVGDVGSQAPPGLSWTRSALRVLLNSFLKSQRTLNEVFIQVNPRHQCSGQSVSRDFVPQFFFFLKELLAFRKLEKIRMYGPSGISFAAGEDVEGSKYFSINSNSFSSFHSGGSLAQSGKSLSLLRMAQEFVEFNPTKEFVLPSGLHGYEHLEESQITKYFQIMRPSRFSLTVLD